MISDDIADILRGRQGLSPAEIARELWDCDFVEDDQVELVERALMAGHRRFGRIDDLSGQWGLFNDFDISRSELRSLVDDRGGRAQEHRQSAFVAAREALPIPYEWQLEALEAWEAVGRRGIVEAVTGSGKTMVGILAMFDALELGKKVHVIVPSIDLQRQWFSRVRKVLPPNITIGCRGGGSRSDLLAVDVLVSVVNSAREDSNRRCEVGQQTLVIADECHRYASKYNSAALSSEFSDRLGLSATYKRDDNGHLKYLMPYFENVCYSLNYDRAIRDSVVADFGVVFLGVRLSELERGEYESISSEMGILFKSFYAKLGTTLSDLPSLVETLVGAAAGHYAHVDSGLQEVAQRLIAALRRRRRLLEFLAGKVDTLVLLGPRILASKGTVIFTQSVEVALSASSALNKAGVRSGAVHAGVNRRVRSHCITKFANGELNAIVAPKILDEGLDFPNADLAIVMASSNGRRQMVQRLGRILRPKFHGGPASLIVLFGEDTVEDPRIGAHQRFRDDIAESSWVVTISSKEFIEGNKLNGLLIDPLMLFNG